MVVGSSLTVSCQFDRRLLLYGLYIHCSIQPKNNRERTTHHRWRGPPPYFIIDETGMIKHCSILPKNNHERTTHHRWRGPPPYSDKVETGMIGFATHQFYFKPQTQFR